MRIKRGTLGTVLTFVVTAALAGTVTGHVRLRYAVDGTPLRWTNPEAISIIVNSDGSDDLSDGSHETAVLSAIEEWNAVSGTNAQIAPRFDAASKSRRDWQSDDVHVVLFDENDSSGYFPGASGIVAITPVSFFTDGRIIDADIIFNGKNFRFTTSGRSNYFDIQDVVAHELGHFIGLDHSGVCGATMYPYVDAAVILHRSLSIDDQNGLRHMYPAGSLARVTGRVTRSSGGGVAGAHVVALDQNGRVVGASLSNANGDYALEGLNPGSFNVYADPLDQPVSSANLGGGQTIETDFETTSLGSVSVAGGATGTLGTQSVGDDVAISLGRVSDDYPLRLIQGDLVTRSIRGSGLVVGSTLTCSDPTIQISNVSFSNSFVQFRATVPAGSPTGHVDLTVVDPLGARDTLVGGLEITPPDPMVTDVTPPTGSPDGNDNITILGADFRSGSRVVIGNRIYRDGAQGGCTVVDSNTIQLSTASTIAGSHDVVVIDPSGVEGRSSDAFTVSVQPSIASIFPAVGTTSGGTDVLIAGEDFVPDLLVEINGVLQSGVTVESPTRLRVQTSPGAPGGPYIVRVSTPAGLFVETAFTYVTSDDPEISLVTPDEADRSGGAQITVYGSGFTEDTRIVFGASAQTGEGGQAVRPEFLSEGSLRAVAPSASVGTTTIMVKDAATGQANTIVSGFTFTGDDAASGDDGGGCAAVIPKGPPGWDNIIGGSGWIFLLLLVAYCQSRMVRVPEYAPSTPRA